MNWLKVFTPIGILAGTLAIGWQLSNIKQAPEKESKPIAKLPVEIQAVEPTKVQFNISSQGVIKPRTETTLISQVSGTVLEVSTAFVSGGTFNKGDILLRIDPLDYEVALEQAKAQLAQATAKLIEEQGKATAAKQDWLREGRPIKKASDLVLRKPYILEAKAAVKAAQADLTKAEQYLDRTIIRAPYDGMTKKKQVDVGQYVSAGSTLGIAFAIDYAEVRLPIKRSDLAYLQLPAFGSREFTGPTVTLSVGKHSSQTWAAQITRQEGVIDEKTRMHYLVARIADPYGIQQNNNQPPLQMGTFVNASIEGLTMTGLTPIPRHLLRKNRQLLVVDKAQTLQLRTVQVVREEADLVYLQSGLKAGDQLCLTAIPSPINGALVVIKSDKDDKQAIAQSNVEKPPTTQPPANKPSTNNGQSEG